MSYIKSSSLKVSIVIPCFNVEEYLSRCIESILSQTHSDFELLLIDDGSHDKTREICEFYVAKDERIKYYYQSNKGVSVARNLGIKYASGEKLMFIDSDDYVTPNILTLLIASVNEKNPFVIPICGMLNVKKGVASKNSNYLKLIENTDLELSNDEVLTLFRYENLSSPCCKLYDTSLVKKYNFRFRENITYQEDLIFNLEYFKQIKSIVLVPEFSYFYIENDTSSSIKYHAHLFQSLPILWQQLELYEDYLKNIDYIKLFFMNQILNNLNNSNHLSSNLSFKEKYNSIKFILQSKIYAFCKSSLHQMKINFLLKILIRLNSYIGIIVFYKMHRILK